MIKRQRTAKSAERTVISYSLFTVLCSLLFVSSVQATATDVYISQTGTGGGTSCSDAKDISFFNSASNWGTGSGQIGPGTTVHLCGTITGAANATLLTANGSGTSGSPITVKWEVGAKLSSPACSPSGCFSTNHQTFLVLDGNGTNPSITSTNNGSPAGGYANSIWALGIGAGGCSNCEFKNLTITNMYMFTDPANDHSAGGGGISISGSSNTKIHDCRFDQMNGPLSDGFANGDANLSIYNNTFNHFNHGIEIGNNNTNVISGAQIYGNTFQNMNTWDDSADDYHHDGIFFYQNTSNPNSVNNFYIYDNRFSGDMGNNATAWIYFNSGLNGIYVFNNLLFNPNSRPASLIEAGYAQAAQDQNLFIYNNYLNCNSGTIGLSLAGFKNISIENNAFDACQVYFFGNTNVSIGTGMIDHNVYGGATSGNDSLFKWQANYISLTALQGLGIDLRSITPAASGADTSGVPQAGAAMIHDGTSNFANLTSSCSGNLSALCADSVGTARPNSGNSNWDAGAYQSASVPIGPTANVYIAQSQAGTADGSSCANAKSVSFFNTSANWGTVSGQIGPGTTVHLCGTITAPANACNYLKFQTGGSPNNPITLKFEPGAILTAPTWGSGCGAIYSNSNNWITVDGGGTGDAAAGTLSGNGTIQATANGTGMTYQVTGPAGIAAYDCSNCTFKNLTISDIYVHSCALPVSNCTDENGDPTGAIYVAGGSNVLITNNVVHDMKWALQHQFNNGDSNITFSNNLIYHADHGVAEDPIGTNAAATNVLVYGNVYRDPQNWDDNGNNNHHDGVHMWTFGTGNSLTHAYVYNNYFYGNFGVNMNACVYQEAFTSGSDSWVFNNICAPSAGGSGNGFIGLGANGGSGGWSAINNTMVGYNNADQSGLNFNGSAGTSYNNIMSTLFGGVGGLSVAPTATDYNDYYNLGASGVSNSTLSGWSSYCTSNYSGTIGCDTHSISANPNLSSTFVPNSGASVIAVGKNLYAACSGQPNPGLGALCFDSAGVARPSTGGWDIGAYQFIPQVNTYYIDFAGGSDANSGTLKSTPWKHHPYMQGWTGAYTHQPGDHFIFKGGVTWTSANWPLQITAGGAAGMNDYYGVDASWFSGAAFSKPIFDGGHAADLLIWVQNANNITFDHLELKGQHTPDNSAGHYNVYLYNSFNILMQYLYIHDWDYAAAVTNVDNDWGSVYANTFGARSTGIVFDHSEMANPENGGIGGCLRQMDQVTYSYLHDCTQGNLHGGALVHDNRFITIGNVIGATHTNVLYLDNWGGPVNNAFIYNNLFLNNVAAEQMYVEACFGQSGGTAYVYNNVSAASGPNNITVDPESGSGACANAYIFNNTLQNSNANTQPILTYQNHSGTNQVNVLQTSNNHLITSAASPIGTTGVLTYTSSNNISETNAQANAEGYTASDNYAPTSASHSTLASGVNLTSSGIISLDSDIQAIARPATGAWDAGAYQSGGAPPPPPPGTVATPTFTPNGGSFSSSVQVALQDSTANSFIYYTLDGSNPTLSSSLYSAPFTLGQSATVKAFAYASGLTPSPVVNAFFTISISGMTPLPLPDLSGLPSYAWINDSLTIKNYPNSNVSFQWSFAPASANSYAASSVIDRASAAPTSFKSPAKTNSLASYGLQTETYQVTVQAVDNSNSNNVSNPATKTVTLVNADFSGMRVYPNPWRSDKHAGKQIIFDRLPLGATVKLFTVSGHLVKTLTPNIDTAGWDLTNDSGDKVASGIYMYLITTGDTGYGGNGQKVRGKLAVVK